MAGKLGELNYMGVIEYGGQEKKCFKKFRNFGIPAWSFQ